MKKIISFSVWGKDPKYTKGAYENLMLQKKYYPDWQCRFYVDFHFPREEGMKLLDNGAEVFTYYKSDNYFGLYWRYDVLKDLSIDRFIIRDVDSRLSLREASAVKKWEDTRYNFHIIRDHEFHNVRICGGLWGATHSFIEKMHNIYDDLLKKHLTALTFAELYHPRGKYFYTDQIFLSRYIWPLIANDHLAHIKNITLKITGGEQLLEVENEDNSFVGEVACQNKY